MSEHKPLIAFEPVPVRPRHDGWTVERQFAVVEKLADCGTTAPTPRFDPFFRSVTANIGEDWRANSPGDCRAPISRQMDSRAAWSNFVNFASHALTCARVGSLQSLRFAYPDMSLPTLATSSVLCAEAVAWHALLIRVRGWA
jgi:hypothetical protein